MDKGKNFYGESRIQDDVMVELVELGEGFEGDYDSSDPDDVELLRFDVSYWHETGECDSALYSTWSVDKPEWIPCNDASYCTQLPASLTADEREKALDILMSKVYEPVMDKRSIKKLCERLSWIGDADFAAEVEA